MIRVHFTDSDLAKICFAPEPAPLMETGLAMAVLQRPRANGLFGGWYTTLGRRLPPLASLLLDVIQPTARGPLFLDPIEPDPHRALDIVSATSQRFITADLHRVYASEPVVPLWVRNLAAGDDEAWQAIQRALRETHAATVAPDWPRIRAGFHADRKRTSDLLMRRGIGETVTRLCPGTRWRGNTLEIDSPIDHDHHTEGQSITLLPSAMWTGNTLVAQHPNRPLTLIYPAPTPFPLIDQPSDRNATARLLGSSRARILSLLTEEHTTSEISRIVDISLPTVSEHTAVLRAAGLITSRRAGKSVHHRCTPLGMLVLNNS